MKISETIYPNIDKQLELSLQNVVKGIQQNPDQSKAVFKAKSRLRNGFLAKIDIRDFSFVSDEPKNLGGTNLGPSPVEYVLGAFAACQEIVIKAYATVLGIDLVSVQVDVEGNLNLNGFLNLTDDRAGFTDVKYKTTVETKETDPEKLQQLEELSTERCPVLDIIKNPVPTAGSIEFKKP